MNAVQTAQVNGDYPADLKPSEEIARVGQQRVTPLQLAQIHEKDALPQCGALADALDKARQKCKNAENDRRNEHHKYDYTSAEGIFDAAKEAMDGTGLTLIPVKETLGTYGNGQMAFHSLTRTLILAHSSGEAVPLIIENWPVIPDRGRPLDKAYCAALTTSLAYKYRDLLCMPRVKHEDDIADRDDRKNDAKTGTAGETKPPKLSDVPPKAEWPDNPPDGELCTFQHLREVNRLIKERTNAQRWGKTLAFFEITVPDQWAEPSSDETLNEMSHWLTLKDLMRVRTKLIGCAVIDRTKKADPPKQPQTTPAKGTDEKPW